MKFFGEFSIAILKTFMDMFLVGLFKTTYNKTLLGLFSWVGGGHHEIYKNRVTSINSKDRFLILHTAYNKTQKHCPLLAKEYLYLNYVYKNKTTLHQDFRSECNGKRIKP